MSDRTEEAEALIRHAAESLHRAHDRGMTIAEYEEAVRRIVDSWGVPA